MIVLMRVAREGRCMHERLVSYDSVILEVLQLVLLRCVLACLHLHAFSFGYLDCACLLQQIWELALLCLQF